MNDEVKKHLLTCAAKEHWQHVGIYPHHGFMLPLFSIRTKNTSGIGEFLDLFDVIDWVAELNIDVIQLLPLNEMNEDFSPYNALSSCALDPIYISLKNLPSMEEKILKEEFQSLNLEKNVCYKEVKTRKLKILYRYFEQFFPEYQKKPEFENFVLNNPWLKEYGLFSVLKHTFQYTAFTDWPKEYQKLDENCFAKLLEEHKKGIFFYIFLQYLAFSQMTMVKAYASKKKIFLLGDIPIFISTNSVDVWSCPELFYKDSVAGAPPDNYNDEGQKWGFYPFNWENHRKTDYFWWKRRIATASNYYHLYRIDHAVGFFRTFIIPADGKPIDGKFIPENPNFWENEGKEKLLMMLNTSLSLPIAEDLGIIPPVTYKVLRELGICGTKVMRWQEAHIKINEYEPISLTTLSTHDTQTLAQWWEQKSDEVDKYVTTNNIKYSVPLSYDTRYNILYNAHHTSSLFHVNPLSEYLALFDELIWPNPDDERINVPGKILSTNWTYRFKPFLEEIIAHEPLKQAIKKIIAPS
jgi:4-alpha-glucanotransferase